MRLWLCVASPVLPCVTLALLPGSSRPCVPSMLYPALTCPLACYFQLWYASRHAQPDVPITTPQAMCAPPPALRACGRGKWDPTYPLRPSPHSWQRCLAGLTAQLCTMGPAAGTGWELSTCPRLWLKAWSMGTARGSSCTHPHLCPASHRPLCPRAQGSHSAGSSVPIPRCPPPALPAESPAATQGSACHIHFPPGCRGGHA